MSINNTDKETNNVYLYKHNQRNYLGPSQNRSGCILGFRIYINAICLDDIKYLFIKKIQMIII